MSLDGPAALGGWAGPWLRPPAVRRELALGAGRSLTLEAFRSGWLEGLSLCWLPVSVLWQGALGLLSAEHSPGEEVTHSGAHTSPPHRQEREPSGQLLQRPPRKGPSQAPDRGPWAWSGPPAPFSLLRPSPLSSAARQEGCGHLPGPLGQWSAQAASLPTILPQL